MQESKEPLTNFLLIILVFRVIYKYNHKGGFLMVTTVSPEFYPLIPIVAGLLTILPILFLVCYRYTDITNTLLISFAAMIFIHLDLTSYDMTYPLFLKYMDFFVLKEMPLVIAILIQIIGLAILSLLPFLIWFIPMVMMDEKLTGDICTKNNLISLKSGIILCFGLIMNIFFVMAVFRSQGYEGFFF